jgi:hypothetical protein
MATVMLSVRVLYRISNRKFEFHALIKEKTRKFGTGALNALASRVLHATAKTWIKLCLCLLLLKKRVTHSATACNAACACVKFNYYTRSIILRAGRNWSHLGEFRPTKEMCVWLYGFVICKCVSLQ